MSAIAIRPLDPSEWSVFREFRLGALKASPGVFWTSYDDVVGLSEEGWRERIKGPAHQVFGLFDEGRLIGITGAFSWEGDPSGATAILVMSFIAAEYRGRGLSRMLYEARLGWIWAQPQFKRIIVGHRASNGAARRCIEAFGFFQTTRVPHIWPDGTSEDEVFYELTISS